MVVGVVETVNRFTISVAGSCLLGDALAATAAIFEYDDSFCGGFGRGEIELFEFESRDADNRRFRFLLLLFEIERDGDANCKINFFGTTFAGETLGVC